MKIEILDLNEENLEKYGLFCKKSQKKEAGYQNKVNWIKQRFKEGLKYKLLWVTEENKKPTSRGFIEYIPGQYNWRGIQAEDWIVIHCLWTTGKLKKKGYGTKLLKKAIEDAKKDNIKGVAVMTSEKCSGLAKSMIFEKEGFKKVDEIKPNYELYALKLVEGAKLPKFNQTNEKSIKACGEGITLIDGCQCPYVQTMREPIKKFAQSKNIPFQVKTIENCNEAQTNGITPYGVYGVIFSGEVISYCYPRRNTDINEIIKKKLNNEE